MRSTAGYVPHTNEARNGKRWVESCEVERASETAEAR